MRHKFIPFILGLIAFSAYSENVVIRYNKFKPNYPIKERQYTDSIIVDKFIETLEFPDMERCEPVAGYGLPNLKKVIFNNVGYTPGGLFREMPNLEEVVFNGLVGHFDCSMPSHCPNLKSIVFNGPISSTGTGFAYNCPALESVEFNGLIGDYSLSNLTADYKCPKFKGFTSHGQICYADTSKSLLQTPESEILNSAVACDQLKRIADFQIHTMRQVNGDFTQQMAYQDSKVIMPFIQKIDTKIAQSLADAQDFARKNGDVLNELELLQVALPYKEQSDINVEWNYALPNDSLLTLSRERFNLDSIAGNGSDVERMKNLLYWVHNNMPHDGSSMSPDCPRNLREIYDSCKIEQRGVNCRLLAIGLTEALLAEGIPARYVTCQSKKWDTDGDCHVITVAWSDSLNKWVWLDPTHAAYITDENGLLLHPGEVRYRLQNDLPLVLNKDANWNNREETDQKYYLDYYMAKNLYIMSCNSMNQSEPEWTSSHIQGKIIALVPQESNYTTADTIITDEAKFWAPPQR